MYIVESDYNVARSSLDEAAMGHVNLNGPQSSVVRDSRCFVGRTRGEVDSGVKKLPSLGDATYLLHQYKSDINNIMDNLRISLKYERQESCIEYTRADSSLQHACIQSAS